MSEEEKKAQEVAEAEAKAKAEEEAKATESSSTEETDYKAIAEANEALALAEKARADAAEALIVKNKAIAKRQENKDGESETLTEDKVTEIVKNLIASTKSEEESPESKALVAAEQAAKEARAKVAELGRALKAKDTVSKDIATTHRDGEVVTAPKLPENSPLKEFTHIGNGVYSLKLKNGKTMFKNTNAGPGQPKTWIE